jgi:single-strand DNA-binding protein
MGSYNKVLLMGNITRDIEVRTLPSQSSVAQIGIAVNRKWRDSNSGELREEVTFVDCEAFGKTAENIAKFFAKGKPIFIEGRLKLDQWKDKTDGSNRSKLKVIVESFEFVESKGGGGPGGGGGGYEGGSAPRSSGAPRGTAGGRPQPAAAAPPSDSGYEPIQEDDIPF